MKTSAACIFALLLVFAVTGLAVAQEAPPAQPAPAPAQPAPAPAQPAPAPAQPAPAPATATAPPAATAPTPATTYLKAIRLVVDGKSRYAGNVKLEFTPRGGAAKLVSEDVIPKMSADDIARDLYKNLTLAAGDGYEVDRSGGRITIEAKKNSPSITLKITSLDIIGVSFLIDED